MSRSSIRLLAWHLPLALILALPVWAAPGLPATEQDLVLGEPLTSFQDLVIDPDNPQVLYWAVGDAGVLKSTDGGQSWQRKSFGLPTAGVSALAIDPADTDHLIAGFTGNFSSQGSHPYRTVNGGERWEPTLLCEHQVGPDNFMNVRQAADATRLLFDPTDSSYFYYMVAAQFISCGGFYRSCDNLVSFDQNPRCFPVPRPECAANDPLATVFQWIMANDASILEVHADGDLFGTTGVHPEECSLMTSTNKGATWNWQDVVDFSAWSSGEGAPPMFIRALALAPGAEEDVRYAATQSWYGQCTDGHVYPNVLLCPFPYTSELVSQPTVVARWSADDVDGMSGGVDCEGTNDCDGDSTPDRVWHPIADTDFVSSLLVHRTDPNRVFAALGLNPQVVMLTPANPADPREVPWDATSVFNASGEIVLKLVQDPASSDAFYVLSTKSNAPVSNRIHRVFSTDGWTTWNSLLVAQNSEKYQVYDLVEIEGSDGHRIVAGTTDGVLVGDELGQQWTGGGNRQASALAAAPSDPDWVYAKVSSNTQIGEGGFDELSLMDREVERSQVMCTNVFHELEVDPDDPNTLYASTGAGIWTITETYVPDDLPGIQDLSDDWTALAREPQGLTDEFVWSMEFDPADASHNTLLAGTRAGLIFRSTDRGASWSPTAINAPNFQPELKDVRDIRFNGGRAFAATAAGVLRKSGSSSPWSESLAAPRVGDLAVGRTGTRRTYAAAENGLYRTRDGGVSWQALPLDFAPPYGEVLESLNADGRHYLWFSAYGSGLYRVSSTVTVKPGTSVQSVVLEWTDDQLSELAGYKLHYGTDPDVLAGQGATQGASPITLGQVTTSVLSGLTFSAQPHYVVLQAVGGAGNPGTGPHGLPLKIDFGIVFAAQVELTDPGFCDPGLRLTWEALPQVLRYKVYRSSIGPEHVLDGPPLAILGPSVTTYDDHSVDEGQTYWYAVTTHFPQSVQTTSNIVQGTASSDTDGDLIGNCNDNCPTVASFNQTDIDGDGLGNLCDDDDDGDGQPDSSDADDDGDGLPDTGDNCKSIPNANQANADGDSFGDVCDLCPSTFSAPPGNSDPDFDGVGTVCDNCKFVWNPDQTDSDSDGQGDACEP